MGRFQGLKQLCAQIQDEAKVELSLNDFSGLLEENADFQAACGNLFFHRNAYCMAVKADKSHWDRCLARKTWVRDRARQEPLGWYGMCYAGREEFSHPLWCQGELVGTLGVGGLVRHADLSSFMSRKLGSYPELEQVRTGGVVSDNELRKLTLVLVEYLEHTYASLAATRGQLFVPESATATTAHELLGHCVEYIRLHYQQPIGAMDLAQFCHVSLSTLSHLFKKNLGMGVKARINAERIRHACELLDTSTLNITEVALGVGFDDPNYFTRVFTETLGLSPREYRKGQNKSSLP